jgi:hypothetical protein
MSFWPRCRASIFAGYGHHQRPAIRASGLIFCSGMVAINPESGEREHGTVTSEARRIFEKSETASGVRRLVPGPNRASARDDL